MDSVAPAATAKAVHSRLINDLQGVLKEFQRAQRLCAEKEMQCVPRETPKPKTKTKPDNASQQAAAAAQQQYNESGGFDTSAEKVSLLQDQQRQEQQQMVESEMEYRQAIIEERDE